MLTRKQARSLALVWYVHSAREDLRVGNFTWLLPRGNVRFAEIQAITQHIYA